MQEVRFSKGETIFLEGDPSTHCYKIISGAVDIILNVPGMLRRHETEKIATCGPGEIIGEMSVIDGSPRSASAVAAEPTVCTSFTSEEIIDLLQNNPKEAMAYVRILIERVRHSNKMLFKPHHGHRG
jgi:CRP-like cAMP-binding protein